MPFLGGFTPSTTSSSSSINRTIVAKSTPQLVASTITSTAPVLSSHLAASSFVVITDIATENGSSFVGSCGGFGGFSDGVASCAFVLVYNDV
jgi:hypothetical protein